MQLDPAVKPCRANVRGRPSIARFGVAIALALAAAAELRADFALNVLHSNDLHSRLQPVNAAGGACPPADDAAGRCVGGIARIKGLLDARRSALEAVIADDLSARPGHRPRLEGRIRRLAD